VTAITAARIMRAYSHRAFSSEWSRVMTATTPNTIDLELTEAELGLSNELQDEDLDRVVGGLQIHKLLDKASVKG
jgi:hypothetical protein